MLGIGPKNREFIVPWGIVQLDFEAGGGIGNRRGGGHPYREGGGEK